MKRNKITTGQSIWINVIGGILIALSCIALGAIIFYVLYPYFDKDVDAEFLSGASVNGLVLSCVTLSITLAIVVPWMMSKSQINAVAEETVKHYYNKDFSQTIQKTHNSLFKAYANESRMIAYFLCQHHKPVWALGWICKSSTIYDRVQGFNQKKTYSALAVSNVYVLIDCILQIYHLLKETTLEQILSNDNEEKKCEVAIRTTRDLVKFCSTRELRDRDYASVFEDKAGKDIPEALNIVLNDFLKCLIIYLNSYCKGNKEDLFDRLELINEEEDEAEKHEAYYYKILKWCQTKKREDVEEVFMNSASELDSLYTKYLTNLKK